jgi:hypothetical protein
MRFMAASKAQVEVYVIGEQLRSVQGKSPFFFGFFRGCFS